MPEAVVIPAFRVNGEWPQINGPEQVVMASEAAKLVAAEQLSWDDFFTMGGLTSGQFVQIARMLDGYHNRYRIDAHVIPKKEQDNSRIIPMARLGELATGWRKGIWQAEMTFRRSTRALDVRPPDLDPEVFYSQKMHALSLLWQTAGAVFDQPETKATSYEYREKLSCVYQDPFASRRERERLSTHQNKAIRETVTNFVLDARHEIGATTGYTPHERVIDTWSSEVFAY